MVQKLLIQNSESNRLVLPKRLNYDDFKSLDEEYKAEMTFFNDLIETSRWGKV